MKFKKIVVFMILFLFVFSFKCVYGKYVYHLEKDVAEFYRDNIMPSCSVIYSTTKWTNSNVIVRIESNKKLEPISGFKMINDGTIFEKEVCENENKVIKVNDLSGNSFDISYSVNNIDKENPKIIGCDNNKTYKAPIELNYIDNVEIKEIFVDRYDEELKVDYSEFYHDSFFYLGIDKTKSTINVRVTSHPKNTRKYKIYLDNSLYTTTEERKFTITNLEMGREYTVKVEAIDKDGSVLDNYEFTDKTGFYDNITSVRTDTYFAGTFLGLDPKVKKIRYAVWNYYDSSKQYWYDSNIVNGEARVICYNFDSVHYASYAIHAYMYDENDNVLSIIGFAIDFNGVYIEDDNQIDPYNLKKIGNYEISVEDVAGNRVVYYIKLY